MNAISNVCRALAVALLFWACDSGAAPAPVKPSTAAIEVDVQTKGERIVAGTTAAAEYLWVLVPPTRVALVPEQVAGYSTLPFGEAGWETVPRFAQWSADPVLAARADLVLTHPWQEAETASVLQQNGVPVLTIPTANGWEDIERVLRTLGKVLHREKEAEKQILRRGDVVARLARAAEKRPKLRAVVYTNDGNGGWAAGKGTTADAVLRMVGLVNAATAAGLEGHAQVDFDRLILLDPDLLVITAPAKGEEKSPTRVTLESTASLQHLRAVKDQRIVELPDALLSSDSPTMVDAADLLALRLDDLLAPRKN